MSALFSKAVLDSEITNNGEKNTKKKVPLSRLQKERLFIPRELRQGRVSTTTGNVTQIWGL